jgi:hypothetical protein
VPQNALRAYTGRENRRKTGNVIRRGGLTLPEDHQLISLSVLFKGGIHLKSSCGERARLRPEAIRLALLPGVGPSPWTSAREGVC